MKRQTITLGVTLLLLAACAQSNESKSTAPQKKEHADYGMNRMNEPAATATDETSTFVPSSAAVETGADSSRRFIRTANLKFKVKSVINATYDIEEIVRDHKGFVTFTDMKSNIDNVDTRAVSADSAVEITRYTITNTLTLRVPNKLLDTTLKDIARNIDYLDYRVIKAEDVALSILEKQLTQRRAARSGERLASTFDNKNLDPTAAAELQNRQEEAADNATIETLKLNDQIAYSTIELQIYQRQGIKREMVAGYKQIDEYQPGIGSRFSDSFAFGWEVIVELVLFLTKLWVLILLGIGTYVAYKRGLFSAKK
ncbi:MAG: hypothetical protein A3D31_07995 [Candidatus Fluviicola riflensis]|nr:MAG: hypothetical protein CHH17_07015 [Candidatus Fluviicola riflensis]OGS79882.1 MAG: hypothetical protein A3D31_07995 [Candidatus Fluviicola riflensis]OGS82397.1 MAG: hypothetical protein A2724_16940 [Fluviicola sp. RIFCSPHIGHO2_01_FULL_43_53]OGS88061.1 MAG: hypothetical protein A3E30_14375 [Fluviicola sp. RIFCSPHIGHO2_12_FULL_43_24]